MGVCENGADVYGVPRSAYPAALKLIPIHQYDDDLERVEHAFTMGPITTS